MLIHILLTTEGVYAQRLGLRLCAVASSAVIAWDDAHTHKATHHTTPPHTMHTVHPHPSPCRCAVFYRRLCNPIFGWMNIMNHSSMLWNQYRQFCLCLWGRRPQWADWPFVRCTGPNLPGLRSLPCVYGHVCSLSWLCMVWCQLQVWAKECCYQCLQM